MYIVVFESRSLENLSDSYVYLINIEIWVMESIREFGVRILKKKIKNSLLITKRQQELKNYCFLSLRESKKERELLLN